MFKQLRLEIGLKDALVEMPKFNKWLSSLLRNKEKLEDIAITTVNAESSAIIMNKVPEKLEDPGKISYSMKTFLRTAKTLIDLYEETMTLRVGKEELVYYADKSEKNKHFVHAISVIDFSRDDPFSGSTTIHSDDPSPSSSLVKTKQNESSITFSPRSDPLHHEFAGEVITLPSRNDREFGEYLSLMTVLCEISTSRSQENVHANQSSIIESLPVSPIPVEDSEPAQEEIDIFLVPDDLIPPGVENDDSEDEDNEVT
ncbi:hypothetical protein Tco_0670342 [Tanacetum coccineum]